MTTELFWLTATIAMTAIFWVPYIINRILENSLIPALRNPKPDSLPNASWAHRMMHAHSNAIENLVLFAPLVLVLHAVNVSTEITATACIVYFWARLMHFIVYTFGIPYLRTLAFFAGFLAQMTLVFVLLGI